MFSVLFYFINVIPSYLKTELLLIKVIPQPSTLSEGYLTSTSPGALMM